MRTKHTALHTLHCTQTLDLLIFQCKKLKNEREYLKKGVLKLRSWPVSESELSNRNRKYFIRYIYIYIYIYSMDLEKINHSNEQM